MKKISILLTALCFVANLVSAQGHYPMMQSENGKMMKHGKGEGMREELNLSDAQQAKMKEIKDEYRTQKEALEKNDKITLKDYNTRLAELQNTMKRKREAVLTAEQKNLVKNKKEKNEAEHRAMAAKRLDDLKANLSLSSDQYQKIETYHEEMRKKSGLIREDKTLTMQQRQAKLKALHREGKDKMKQLLTPEQVEKMKEIKKQKSDGRTEKMQDMREGKLKTN